MALSLAQSHLRRVRAAQEAAKTAPAATMEGATNYELHLASLIQDRLRLKQVQSNEGKAELKRQLLPQYTPYVEGVLAAGQGAQDEVLTTLMLWNIDVGDFANALVIAGYVLKHGMVMPDRFERTTGCLIAEEVAEAALKAQKSGGSFQLAILEDTELLTREQDMPDQARAKLHLALGKALAALFADDAPAGTDTAPLEQAKQHLARAIELHTSCGGKKDLEGVDRLLKKHAAPPAS